MKKVLLLSLLLPLLLALSFRFWYLREIERTYPLPNGKPVLFSVAAGDSTATIAGKLKRAKLIGSEWAFKLYARQENAQGQLKAGTYELGPDYNMAEITRVLSTGRSLTEERNITLIEGWQLKDIDEYLAKEGVLQAGDFFRAAQAEYDYDFLKDKPSGFDLEGFIFPDTYRIFNSATADDIVRKALDNFAVKLGPELRAEIARQGKSIREIVIMASIIEKEVSKEQDRAIVAGILYQRMDIGMRLEVDATINYLSGKNNPSSLAVDLAIDSPYNTYKNYGLPPGPISNPSLSAIRAAIYPQESRYLFYLNRQDTGETIFSRNYEEHLQNKAKYLD